MNAAVTLYRIDPARNMRRFYRIEVLLDLFGYYCLLRTWGRIGKPGQVRSVPYSTKDEAQAAFMKQRGTKERKGYVAA